MSDEPPPNDPELFRPEAVKATAIGRGEGDVIRITPRWLDAVYHLLIWMVLVTFIFCTFVDVDEYAAGQAVIRYANLQELTAKRGGTLQSIDVRAGDLVTKGTVVAHLVAEEEQAELDRTKREFELQLVKVLRDPNDTAARSALTTLRTAQDVATTHLEALIVRAPFDGVVGDVRARTGQYLTVGDSVASLSTDDARLEVVAMLPGHYRPQLKPGMKLRVQPTGYSYAYQQLTIDSVDDQVVGPAQIQKFLGRDLADAVKVEGSVVIVRARPPSNAFVANGTRYEYHHGMVAFAESPVRSESVLATVVPALRALSEGAVGGK